jgi:hypothetical protein
MFSSHIGKKGKDVKEIMINVMRNVIKSKIEMDRESNLVGRLVDLII